MLRSLFSWLHGKKLRSVMMKILKVLRFDAKSSTKQYFLNTLLVKRNIYRVMESSICRWVLLEVRKFGFRFTATEFASLWRIVVSLTREFILSPLRPWRPIIFQTEYSIALLLYILSPTRSTSIAKERKIRLKLSVGRAGAIFSNIRSLTHRMMPL